MHSKQLLLIAFFSVIFSSCDKSSSPFDINTHTKGSWQLVRESQNEGFYNSVFFVDEINGWAVGDSGRIIHSDDGGKNWIYQESGTESSLQDIQFINQYVGWAVGSNNTILKTNNGGQKWVKQEIQSDISKAFMALSFINENIGWIVDNYGGIFHTINSGDSWTHQESHTHWAITSVQFKNAKQGWAITTNKIALHTNNSGENWVHCPIPSESDEIPIVCNDIFFVNEKVGWIIGTFVGGTMQENVPLYHTENAGLTWETKTYIPSSWLTSILFIDKDLGWITSKGKIFNTFDGGSSWNIQYQDDNEIFDDISFVNSSHGWALGFRGNIYEYVLMN